MKKKYQHTILEFQQNILYWYHQNYRQLPWRQSQNPYHIWISEVLAQQTRIVTVIPYYHRFIARFPDIKTLAAADLQTVLKVWEGLGYYSRARNLYQAARIIVEKHNGDFPTNYSEILTLPGIGKYIAAAIASIAFAQAYAVLDGNVKRVYSRLHCAEKAINDPKSQQYYQKLANQYLDRTNPGNYNQAVMELGAVVCKSVNPNCSDCPASSMCCANCKNLVREYPHKIQQQKVPTYHIAVGVIRKNNKVLITKRKEQGLLGGLWEFPGGKIQKGENVAQACIREIREETGITVKIDHYLTHVRHAYSHFKIEVDVFLCDYMKGKVTLRGPVDFRWISVAEIADYPFPKANHKFFEAMKESL